MYEIVVGRLGYEYLDIDELDGISSTDIYDLIKTIKSYINKRDNAYLKEDGKIVMSYQLYKEIKWDINETDFNEEGCIELITLPEFSIYIRKIK
jgi:hypothetical protein